MFTSLQSVDAVPLCMPCGGGVSESRCKDTNSTTSVDHLLPVTSVYSALKPFIFCIKAFWLRETACPAMRDMGFGNAKHGLWQCRLAHITEAFGQNTRSVWAEHPERLGRTLYQQEKEAHDNLRKKGAVLMSFFKQYQKFNKHIFIKALNKLHFYIYLQRCLTTEFSFINNIYN